MKSINILTLGVIIGITSLLWLPFVHKYSIPMSMQILIGVLLCWYAIIKLEEE